MKSGVAAHREPANHWWWHDDDGARVVAVAYGCLVITGPLGFEELEAIDRRCRDGSALDVDFGSRATLVDLSRVRAIRFVPARQGTVLVLDDGTSHEVRPTGDGALAEEIFDYLADIMAPGVEPRPGFVSAARMSPRRYDGRLSALLGAVAVAILAVSAWADPDRISTGPLNGLVQALNDFFVSVGWLSILFVLVGLIVTELWGAIRSRAATARRLAAVQVDVGVGEDGTWVLSRGGSAGPAKGTSRVVRPRERVGADGASSARPVTVG